LKGRPVSGTGGPRLRRHAETDRAAGEVASACRMRLVIARCSVDYVGRLTAHLPMAPRLILLKADGSVSIHSDDRAYKPLNWMNPPCKLREEGDRWTVTHGKTGEKLILTIEEIL